MAQITLNTDDLTGETLPDGTPTTTILINDERNTIAVEIDLSDASFKKLYDAVQKFASKGRAITPPQKRTAATGSTEAADARAWALAHRPDLNVKERGAVPTAVLVAYRAHLEGQTLSNSNPSE